MPLEKYHGSDLHGLELDSIVQSSPTSTTIRVSPREMMNEPVELEGLGQDDVAALLAHLQMKKWDSGLEMIPFSLLTLQAVTK
jgi:hypothetical protein